MLPRNEYSEGNHQCSTMPVESVTSQKRPGLTGRGASAAGIVCVYPPKSGDDGVIPREPFTRAVTRDAATVVLQNSVTDQGTYYIFRYRRLGTV